MIVLVLLLAAPVEPPDPRPTFRATLRRAVDRLDVLHRKDHVAWRVHSPGGIGGAVVELTGGEAPRTIHVEFPGLNNLESFTLDDGRGRIEGRLAREGGAVVQHFDARGRPVAAAVKGGASLRIERLPAGGIRAVFTADRPGRRWQVEWINEYR